MQRQSAHRRFFILALEVYSCFIHGFYHLVEADSVPSVAHKGKSVVCQCPLCRKGISFNAGNLNQAGNRIAGKAEVVFEAHFCRIFYLINSTAHHLSSCT